MGLVIGDPVFQRFWWHPTFHWICAWRMQIMSLNDCWRVCREVVSCLSMFNWIWRNGQQEMVVLILEKNPLLWIKVVEKLSTAQAHTQGLWALCFDSQYDLRWWKRCQDVAALGRQTCSRFKTFGLYLYKLNVRDLFYTCSCWKRRIRPLSLPGLKPSLKSPDPDSSDIPQLLGLELSNHVLWLKVWQAAWSAEAKPTTKCGTY